MFFLLYLLAERYMAQRNVMTKCHKTLNFFQYLKGLHYNHPSIGIRQSFHQNNYSFHTECLNRQPQRMFLLFGKIFSMKEGSKLPGSFN